MRHAARFDDIFYRGLFSQAALNTFAANPRWKKKIKIAMKIEPNGKRLYVN